MRLPQLDLEGHVTFESADDLEVAIERYLKKGALAVRPTRPLAPLEQLDVVVRGGWLPREPAPRLRCEVVHLDPDRALLRLLEPAPAVLLRTRPPPENDVPATAAPLVPTHAPPPLDDAPKPSGPPHAGTAKGFTVSPTSAFDPPGRNVLSSSLPPYLSVETLRFANAEDFRNAREHLEKVAALMAVCDSPPPAGSELEIRFVIGSHEPRTKTRSVVQPMSGGTVVVQAVDLQRGFRALLAEVDAGVQPAAPTPAGGAPTLAKVAPRVALTIAREGVAVNPTSAAEILALPVNRPPTEAEIRLPSVALLLRWMRTQIGCTRLDFTVEGQPLYTAVFVDRREVRYPVSLNTLGKALAMPRGSYTLIELKKPPVMSTTGRTLHLITEVVRGLIARVSLDDLASGFPDHRDECPRVLPFVADGLGLPQAHARLVKQSLQGEDRFEDIPRVAAGARVAWDTLYLLEMYGALAWQPAPVKNTGRTMAAQTMTSESLLASFEAKDHFAALGLHWSCSPTEIEPALLHARGEHGPGGAKRALIDSRDVADKIAARIEEAGRVLLHHESRRRYRQATFNLIWHQQAQLLVTKAKLALYRRDLAEARTTLLAAQDLTNTVEATELLAMIMRNETS